MEIIREGPSASRPPVLDGKNYSYWKPLLKLEVDWTDAEEQASVGNVRALKCNIQCLLMEKPWAGSFVDHWPRLDNYSILPRLSMEIPLFEGKTAWVLQSSIHNEAHNYDKALTLGQRLIEGQTRWGVVTKAMRHETYFKDNRHHLVSSTIPPSSQPKLPKNRRSNLGGKEILLVKAMAATLEEEVNEHKEQSDSSKSDCHWKRLLKKAKVSGDDLDERVDSAIKEVVTLKTPVSRPAEQSLRPSALFEEIHRGKMTVGGKDIGSPLSKGDSYPKAPLQKISSTHAPLRFSESPLDTSNRQATRNPNPSQWIGEKVVSNFFKKITLCMWEDIQDKIMRTPFEYIPRLRPDIATVLSGIEKIHADGLTPLEEYLNSYLKRVDNFNDVQSSYSKKLLSIDKTR
ncbi:putative mitochondrial protein [Cucumis melo var. makuwa]|uniref:Mitochondrial protein n=1 Tax=Cucumis melo var. makuwa TaxID=1194695 RepID=A0A5D3BT42_CUCMM|nr:putative mitochondrial protein [Cucumis melo var. makuwa]TYK02345.1 putative mitochondrial protein [Cucumis melo var. makuwa]